jgi:hypothetical protein
MAKPRGNVYRVGASYRVKFPRGKGSVTRQTSATRDS